jgi:sec-independent protein translocase protein TatA
MEIVVIAGVALLLFGGKRLADIGGGLGQGIKAFKQGLREADADEKSTSGKDTGGPKGG